MSGGIGFDGLSAAVSWVLNTNPETSPYRNVKDIVVFVGAALALYFAFRRMKAAEDQNKNQTKAIEAQTAQIELSRRDQLSKRFTEAVKQLGDDKLAIRMGGIAGLWAVATESTHPEDRIMVLDVLCAFVRNAPHPADDEPQKIRPDVALAMDRLGSVGPYFPWGDVEEGHEPYVRDFSGAYLVGFEFRSMKLKCIIMKNAFHGSLVISLCDFSNSYMAFNEAIDIFVYDSCFSEFNMILSSYDDEIGNYVGGVMNLLIVNTDLSNFKFVANFLDGGMCSVNYCFHKEGCAPSGLPSGSEYSVISSAAP